MLAGNRTRARCQRALGRTMIVRYQRNGRVERGFQEPVGIPRRVLGEITSREIFTRFGGFWLVHVAPFLRQPRAHASPFLPTDQASVLDVQTQVTCSSARLGATDQAAPATPVARCP